MVSWREVYGNENIRDFVRYEMDLRYTRPIVNISITLVKQSLSPLGDLIIYQKLRIGASQHIYAMKRDFKRFHNLKATFYPLPFRCFNVVEGEKTLNPR